MVNDVVDFFGNKLDRGLATISCVCDPEIFVIGGGVSAAGQIILDRIRDSYRANPFPSCENTRFALASLGNDADIFGCARLMLE